MSRFILFVILLGTICSGSAEEPLSFNRDVRPILSDKCFKCHGPDSKNQKSDFRLDSFEAATKPHDGFSGIVPGKVKESEVHHRIHSTDSGEQMPPLKSKLSLSAVEIATLDRWIAEGAPYEKHWSLIELPDNIAVPELEGLPNPIDRFVRATLQTRQLKASPEVSREKWLRRVTFDITGLPPTLSELDKFLADKSPLAYEKAVDRLLTTTAYAERMTAEWLDVARYSDTYGYQVDRNRDVWAWRDWVINAFRDNIGYDEFITRQVAGDLLPKATRDDILATTFNRLHSQKVEGGSVEEEFRIEYIADRVHTFGTAFLGLTMECTRCHDHKYDPLTQRDYYSLSAFFSNIDESGLYAFFTNSVPTPTLKLPTEPQIIQLSAAENEITKLENELDALKQASQISFEKWDFEAAKKDSPGLKVHLDFENNAGNKFINRVSEKSPASTNSNNKIVAGKVGQAVQLTGDDAVNLPKEVGNFSRDQPFSLAMWIQTPDQKERAVICRRSKSWTDAASRGYELLLEDGKLSASLIHFWPGNAISIRTVDVIPVNTWQHVAVTYDGSSRADGLHLYLNGKLSPTKIIKNHLTREIVGGGDPFVGLGQRMRDKGFKNGLVDEFYVYDREISPLEISQLVNPQHTPTGQEKYTYFQSVAYEPILKKRSELRAAREKRSAIQKGIKEIMVMRDLPPGDRPSHILLRGLYSDRGEPVAPDTPTALPPLPKNSIPNRLDLAQWLTKPNHPLTARVAVNRYWQMMFGRGLVSTSEDFGSQGKPPTHPALLDWLARDFIDHGWDLHHLLKQIALSATYRQTADVTSELRERDPQNLWLARGPTYKLPAEMIRDNALAVSGLLSKKVGGPSVRPYDLAVSFKPINPDKGENLYRRSIYTFWKRTGPSPMMMTLDSSKKDVCRVKREETASPLQSLVLLNSPQFVEAARVTAENLLKKHSENYVEIIQESFRLFTSRNADEKELTILQSLLEEQINHFESHPENAAEYFKTGDKPPAEKGNSAKLAGVTVLVSTLMNFDESITKR